MSDTTDAFEADVRRTSELTLDLLRVFDALTTTIAHADGDPAEELRRIKREAQAYRKALLDPDRRR